MGYRLIKTPPYCHFKKGRRPGTGYWYYCRKGYPLTRLPGLPFSSEFMAVYNAVHNGPRIAIGKRPQSGTMAALVVSYLSSPQWKALERSTQRSYRDILDKIRAEHGTKAVARLETKHIRKLIEARSDHSAAANRLLSILRILLDRAVETDLINANPAHNVKPLKKKSKGIHSWTEDGIARFEAAHPIGSKARLAFALLLYLGQRKSDVVKLGPQHRHGAVIRLVQTKTKAALGLPVHPVLDEILRATPTGHLAYLTTGLGKPYTASGFGNWFRQACDEAGLPHCTSHGLRKAAARRLAEAGASPHEIASITGHESLREVERYARAANRARLAETATAKVVAAFPGSKQEHRS